MDSQLELGGGLPKARAQQPSAPLARTDVGMPPSLSAVPPGY